MNKANWQVWLDALRSGNYKQGRSRLKYKEKHEEEIRYCCLGVLCEVAEVEWKFYGGDRFADEWDPLGEKLSTFIPFVVIEDFLGVKEDEFDEWDLANRNDGRGEDAHSFNEIADFIEERYLNE